MSKSINHSTSFLQCTHMMLYILLSGELQSRGRQCWMYSDALATSNWSPDRQMSTDSAMRLHVVYELFLSPVSQNHYNTKSVQTTTTVSYHIISYCKTLIFAKIKCTRKFSVLQYHSRHLCVQLQLQHTLEQRPVAHHNTKIHQNLNLYNFEIFKTLNF